MYILLLVGILILLYYIYNTEYDVIYVQWQQPEQDDSYCRCGKTFCDCPSLYMDSVINQYDLPGTL